MTSAASQFADGFLASARSARRQRDRARSARAGFSFVEVLFSVIILGIGFIMVAAIFPVSIRQSQSSTEETIGADVARGAAAVVTRVLEGSDYFHPTTRLLTATGSTAAPYTGAVRPMPAAAMKKLTGNLINPADPRFAWVILYRRDGNPADVKTWSPFVQIFVVAVESRLTTVFDDFAFDPGRYANGSNNAPAAIDPREAPQSTNLDPRSVAVQIRNGDAANGQPDLIDIQDIDGSSTTTDAFYRAPGNIYSMKFASEAAITGAYVIIGNDRDVYTGDAPRSIPANLGRMNGRIYRIGNFVSSAGGLSTYELAPGGEFSPDPGSDGFFDASGTPSPDDIYQPDVGAPAADKNTWQAWIVGRSFLGEKQAYPYWRPIASGEYDGLPMDVGAFTTFIKVN